MTSSQNHDGPASASVIQHALQQHEVLLWAGKPRQGLVFRRFDRYLIPFSALWFALAVYWEILAFDVVKETASGMAATFYPLSGIPFVLLGLYALIGRFIVDQQRRANTCYGLTETQVIIISGLLKPQHKQLDIQAYPLISLSEEQDGYGSITFAHDTSVPMTDSTNIEDLNHTDSVTFEMIADARKVHALIQDQQARIRDARMQNA